MNARAPNPAPDTTRSAFTLIEILLVGALLMMTTLVAAPAVVRSFRGARLNASVRVLTMAHRQARALASLRQQQMALIFDSVRHRVELVRVGGGADLSPAGFDGGGEDPEPVVESEWIRWLAGQIRIADCRVPRAGQEHEGLYWVRYYPGGTSDGFEIVLADEQDRRARVKADPITGRVEVLHE